MAIQTKTEQNVFQPDIKTLDAVIESESESSNQPEK